jgi:Fe-S-cluster containining protein
MIKQLIPSEFCLKCQGCCRFSEQDSVWVPCLLDEEIQDLLDRDIPAAFISGQRKILPIFNPGQDNFICPFLDIAENKCKIYAFRPFECQLYPFLINLRNKKIILTVDLRCPYIKENINSPELKDYIEYLTTLLNLPQQIKLLKSNPQTLQAYEDVLEVIELNLPDETK